MLLGFTDPVPLARTFQHLLQAPRITRRVPPAILGLLVGGDLYCGIVGLGGARWLGATVGGVSSRRRVSEATDAKIPFPDT